MLKYVAVVCVLASLAAAQPQNPQDVQILKYDSDVRPDGYNFDFETSDGTKRQESGQLDNPTAEDASLTVNGEYSFQLPDGQTLTVKFTAGPNGYQPQTSFGKGRK